MTIITPINPDDLTPEQRASIKRLRAYKTKLVLNNAEQAYFYGCAGFARFVYNWGLAEWKRQYEMGEKPSAYSLKKQFNAIKDEQFPWTREYPYTIEQEAFDHLGRAFQNFFRNIKKGNKLGYPKFKSRQDALKFSVRDSISIASNEVKLPRVGWVRLAESNYIPTNDAKILSANISKYGGNWYISLQVEETVLAPEKATGKIVGVDMGIKSLAVCSDGTIFENPKTLYKHEKKLARLQRELNRREKGSRNREKTKSKFAKLHREVTDLRKHTLHSISRHVTVNTKPSVVVIEDLNVAGMLKNGHLAKSISDASMGELRRQIGYKAEWSGVDILVADQWFPSSKLCNACGAIKEDLSLDERVYVCECGSIIDRDLNAALNLAALGRRGEAPRIACGVGGQQDATVKQEVGTAHAVRPAAVVGQPTIPSYI